MTEVQATADVNTEVTSAQEVTPEVSTAPEVNVGDSRTVEPTAESGPTFNLPDNLKDNSLYKGIENWDDLHKKLNGLEGLLGKKGIPSDNTEEAWSGWLDQLGDSKDTLKNLLKETPEIPEKYEFTDIEGYDQDDGEKERFEKIFKERGIPQDQADALRQDLIKGYMDVHQQEQARLDTEFQEMAVKEWGNNWEDATAEATLEFKKRYTEEQRNRLSEVSGDILITMLKDIQREQAMKKGDASIPGFSQPSALNDDQVMSKFKELDANKGRGGRFLREYNEFRTNNRDALARKFLKK